MGINNINLLNTSPVAGSAIALVVADAATNATFFGGAPADI